MNDSVAFLMIAVLGSVIGITVVLLRNRRPSSMEHSIEEFERGLRALTPDDPPSARHRSE